MEVTITYETLFELLRTEKTRGELQKLDDDFFSDVVAYLKEKEEVLEQQRNKQDLFANQERANAEKQVENIRGILRELYEKREKKIIEMAVDASRTDSSIIDTSNMLIEEKSFYEKVLGIFNSFRQGVLFNLQQAKIPNVVEQKFEEPKVEPEIAGPEVEAEPKVEPKQETPEIKQEEPEAEPAHQEPQSENKLIQFTQTVPKFVGVDLKEYGPFNEGDSAELPNKIAEVIINKGSAQKAF